MLRDANGQPHFTLDSFNVEVDMPSAFAGGTTNARGDDGGTSDPLTLFTVVGDVLVRIFGVCTTDLTGATATVEVGVAGNTASLIAQSTATDIDANEIWSDTTPTVGVDTLASVLGPYLVVNGLDIIETIGTADVTAGNIYYICLWRPIRPGSTVTAVTPPTALPT